MKSMNPSRLLVTCYRYCRFNFPIYRYRHGSKNTKADTLLHLYHSKDTTLSLPGTYPTLIPHMQLEDVEIFQSSQSTSSPIDSPEG